MVSKLVFMLSVSVFLSFQSVILSARPVLDAKGSLCPQVHEDGQPTLKYIGCKNDKCGTFAVPTPESRAPHANRILMDSSRLGGRQAQTQSSPAAMLANASPNPPPSDPAPGPGTG